MLRKGGKTATTKGITVSADSMLGEQVFSDSELGHNTLRGYFKKLYSPNI